MKEKKSISVLYSWPVIIVAFFVFWPLGVILLLRRATLDDKTGVVVGTILTLLALLIWLVAAVFFIGLFFRQIDTYDIIAVPAMAIVGFVVVVIGINLTRDAENPKKYGAVIRSGLRRLDEIGAAVGNARGTVKADLERMIRKGQLEGAYINESTFELVMPEDMEMPAEKNPEGRKVECAGCGASNTVYGDTGECEYCGSVLK